MNRLAYLWCNVLHTLLRVFPAPCEPGLVRIGRPGPDAPVLLTCNFRLTVARVKRALAGLDAYLLVANSRGANVWCAATGGLLTDHDVVTVLKTTRVGDLVDHRRLVLPQLAATGIEARSIQERTGWTVVWGPVEAASLPEFLRSGSRKTTEMRTVGFPWIRRVEMAVAWAFPMSVLALLVAPFWSAGVLPLVGLAWGASLGLFLAFPLYRHRLRRSGQHVGFVLFDFGERGVPLLAWILFLLGLAGYAFLAGEFWPVVARWGLASLVVVLILGIDLMGSTPLYKSGLHEDRRLRVTLDPDRCTGVGACEEVCPASVFELDAGRIARLERGSDCVQCGACVVQCPADAIHFEHPDGGIVPPDTIRRFKLNLLGTRVVRRDPSADPGADPL